jgi:hypothetical protein
MAKMSDPCHPTYTTRSISYRIYFSKASNVLLCVLTPIKPSEHLLIISLRMFVEVIQDMEVNKRICVDGKTDLSTMAEGVGGSFVQLEHYLETNILDTPTKMNRVREYKVRDAIRVGKTDDFCVEAYAVLMDRIQYNKDDGNRLQEKEKEV